MLIVDPIIYGLQGTMSAKEKSKNQRRSPVIRTESGYPKLLIRALQERYTTDSNDYP